MALLAAALGTLLTLASAMALGEPANVLSLGLHQEYGACAVPDIDLSGYARTKYLCQAELDEDFHLGCVKQRLPQKRRLEMRSALERERPSLQNVLSIIKNRRLYLH